MERDNQKEKVISIDNAKDLIARFWSCALSDGTNYIWFGEPIEEYRGGYLIPAIPLKKGEENPDGYIRAWVDYTTGEVFMGFDVTA